MPSALRMSSMIPAMMTQDRKFGIYTSVWKVRLTALCITSFSNKAKITGTTIPPTILNADMYSVFQMVLTKFG
ncbi:hypothetical protein D3C76_1807510 [compost metagenome]